jgi:Hypoxia induced protein conserved region
MKILTKEEEAAHYHTTVAGGLKGGALGLLFGVGAVSLAHHRFPSFRSLTLPLKAFLATSAGTFAAIIQADRASQAFETSRHHPFSAPYKDQVQRELELARANEPLSQRLRRWGREHRYEIVGVSWVAGMGLALGMVGRNRYLTGAQKLVQARVYAQGLTIAVLVATAALEIGDAKGGRGRWETVLVVDPTDPEHRHLVEKKIHHEAYKGEDLWKGL